MNATPTHNPATRAHVCDDDCPVCLGTGRLPSMTVVGMTNPCPRCTNALKPGVKRDLAPFTERAGRKLYAHGGRGMTLAEIAEAEGQPLDPRRADDRTPDDTQRALWLGVVIGIGLGVFVWLVVGIFTRLG